jgi:hypothetical protein
MRTLEVNVRGLARGAIPPSGLCKRPGSNSCDSGYHTDSAQWLPASQETTRLERDACRGPEGR